VQRATQPQPGAARPGTLTAATVLVLLEALLAIGFAVYLVVEALTAPTGDDPAIGWGTAVLALVFGIGMLAVARSLSRLRGWGRAPAIVMQILLLTIGIPLVQGGSTQLIVGVPLTIAAVVTLVLLLTPSAGQALDR
jgi:peptidoglycan/LPS O-acetylase OafA/YrhL